MKNNAKTNQLRDAQYLLFYEADKGPERDKDTLNRKKLYKSSETDKNKTGAVITAFRGTIIENFFEPSFIYDIEKKI